MGAILSQIMLGSSSMAQRWWMLPSRAGFSVEMETLAEKEKKWQAIAKRHDFKLQSLDRLIGQDLSGFVVTPFTVIHVDVFQHWREEVDSSRRFIEMFVLPETVRMQKGYESRVVFSTKASDMTMRMLGWSFLASGASSLDESGWLFLCPKEVAGKWPEFLRGSSMNCTSFSLSECTGAKSSEKFVGGRLSRFLAGINIFSGPAFDPSTWGEATYLALQPYGLFSQTKLLNQIASRALQNAAIKVSLDNQVVLNTLQEYHLSAMETVR